MDKRFNGPGINILIFFIAIVLLLYITYSLQNYHNYSLKADTNPSIGVNDAAPEPASSQEDTDTGRKILTVLPVKESEPGNIYEEQNAENDNNDIDNAGADMKDGDTEEIEIAKGIQSETETKPVAGKSSQEESNPEKLQVMEAANREMITFSSEPQRDVNLDGTLNEYVLDVIKTYRIGNYPYLLNKDYKNYNGVTETLYYKGELLLKANPNGDRASCCTGITFEVFFKAMQNRNRDLGIDIDNFNGMNKEELYDFALIWYMAKGPKDKSNMALAMEKYGVGKRIHNVEELRAGDFVNLSRENKTGHSVVFINWIREGDKIIGLRYWSSQGSTNGINYKEEYFNIKKKDGSKYGNVIIDSLYMGRISPVSEYKGFK